MFLMLDPNIKTRATNFGFTGFSLSPRMEYSNVPQNRVFYFEKNMISSIFDTDFRSRLCLNWRSILFSLYLIPLYLSFPFIGLGLLQQIHNSIRLYRAVQMILSWDYLDHNIDHLLRIALVG